jgi:phosphoadenosine phosphosulfate reductase
VKWEYPGESGSGVNNGEFSAEQIQALSKEFESKSPREIIAWSVQTFLPEIAASSSFQTQSLPLLHMIAQVQPALPIFFLDTGFHFWETLLFREQLERIWGLNIVDLRADDRWQVFLNRFGRDLYMTDPDLCCYLRKVQPMQKALKQLRAWISGIRRDQTTDRAQAQILELEPDGLIKINPLLNWTKKDVQDYIRNHNLPIHPLTQMGYQSIGCKVCTRAVLPGEDERAGRWSGTGKTECGLHTEMFRKDESQTLMQNFILKTGKTGELKPDTPPAENEK